MNCPNLVWLRNDLRLEDNPAIFNACQKGKIRIIFIMTVKQWQKHHVSEASIGLRLDVIKQLIKKCNLLGITFDVLSCDYYSEVPDLLKNHCLRHNITHMWFNKETPIDEQYRDKKVIKLLNKLDIKVKAEAYDLMVSQPVYNLSGAPFKVFTAFYKKWLMMLKYQNNQPLPLPKKQAESFINNSSLIESHEFNYRTDLWPCRFKDIHERLTHFSHKKIFAYEKYRDFPNISGTSLLSPYLSLGCLGPRTCIQQIKHSYENTQGIVQDDWAADSWLRELAWRDFYRQLMIHFPYICKNQDFKSNTRNVPWRIDKAGFEKWCQGQTGFPIIDAAMRQLNQTGWMHNRLRMLSASFLTKLLFIDWRHGEKYFMQTLVDGEFSANNGGWQWSASTGCDSAPYFRVFNPFLQSEKFDKTGDFIRKFVPEIALLDNKSIHHPSLKQHQSCAYVKPIVDYKSARARAIELFRNQS